MDKKQDIPPIFGKIVLAILVLGLLFMVISHFNIKHKFESDDIKKSITVGEIVKFRAGAKTAPSFNYEFSVGEKVYSGSYIIVTELGQKSGKELREYVGKKYKVWYVVDDPTYSKLLFDRAVE